MQLYALHAFAKTEVPIDTTAGILDTTAAAVYGLCMKILKDEHRSCDTSQKVFALHALHNLLQTRPGRTEFFNTRHITVQGETRQNAIDRHQISQLKILYRSMAI